LVKFTIYGIGSFFSAADFYGLRKNFIHKFSIL
jgi:hypothetical protein